MFMATDHSPGAIQMQGIGVSQPNRLSRWLPFPIHFLYLIFLIMLIIKLQFGKDLPWISVFISLFVADLLNTLSKTYNFTKELYTRHWNHPHTGTRDTQPRENLFRLISSIIDAIGGFFGKFGVFIYIELTSKHIKPASLTLVKSLIPLFTMVVVSVILKLMSGPPRLFGGPLIGNHSGRWTTFLHPLLVFSYRGLQPLLIALQIDGIIFARWSIVFIPLWIMVFGGIGISVILITCAPYVHRTAPLPIRESVSLQYDH
jgi:hypothetical protein